MKSVKGTQTERNLLTAFAGESQARNRYTYFASVARKAGFEQISGIFLETAENEKEHAKRFFKFLEGGDVEIQASYPAGIISDTATNLEEAADGEKLEWTTIYKDFEAVKKLEIAQREANDKLAINIKKKEKEASKIEEDLKRSIEKKQQELSDLDLRVKELEGRRAQNEWISTKKKEPPVGQWVIVYNSCWRRCQTAIARYLGEYKEDGRVCSEAG